MGLIGAGINGRRLDGDCRWCDYNYCNIRRYIECKHISPPYQVVSIQLTFVTRAFCNYLYTSSISVKRSCVYGY